MNTWIKRGAWACLAGLLTPATGALADASIFASGRILVAAKGDDLPLSKDALFDMPEPPAKPAASGKAKKAPAKEPASRDALFELDDKPAAPAAVPAADTKTAAPVPPAKPAPEAVPATAVAAPAKSTGGEAPTSKDALFETPPAPATTPVAAPATPVVQPAPEPQPAPTPALAAAPAAPKAPVSDQPIRGFFQAEAAHTNTSPTHWSKALGRLELGTSGSLGGGMQWKLSGRLDLIGQYDHYNGTGQDSPRAEFTARENYLDFSGGDWDFRVGRQHIVWGEMVGMFIADVVSAKDLRDFILPDFQVVRIPQWAARAEYFSGDNHAELIWIPFPSYDRIGKQGADFYPTPPSPLSPPGTPPTILAEDKPGASLSNGNFGVRLSRLKDGWDLAGFLYRSTDSQQTFYHSIINTQFTPRHDRIWQAGGSLAKDLGSFVLKAEAVYTKGRKYNLAGASFFTDADGVVPQDTLDWAVGLDFNPDADTRFNVQLYQRAFFDHNPDIIPERFENGYSLLVNRKLPGNWEAEALWVSSLNRSDWMLRPKLAWNFERNWRLVFGLDLFHGPATGIFGQYTNNDRVYTELRYDF